MENDATQKGAEEVTPEVEAPKVRTLAEIRAEQTEAIADRRAAEKAEEDKEPEKQTEPEPEKVQEPAKPTFPEKVKIKVDGTELEVPGEEVWNAGIQAKQKLSAADRRLQEATEELRKAREERARAQLFKPPAKADAEKPPEPEKKEEIDDTDLDELAQAFQYGEKEEIKKALTKLREPGRQTPTLDDSKIAELVDKRVAEREAEALKIKKAEDIRRINDQFDLPPDKGGFKDLLDDPQAKELVLREIDFRIAGGSRGDVWETYEQAGKTVREFLETRKNFGKPAAVTDLAQRRERKKAIDTITPAGGREPGPTPEPKKQTTAEIIADMRKSRPGQG